MDAQELATLIQSGSATELTAIRASTFDGRLSVDERVALQVTAIDCSMRQADDLEIYDDANNLLGVLCFCRSIEPVDITTMSEWRRTAYLTEVPLALYNQPYRFEYDYVVLHQSRLTEYLTTYMESAPLWGFFSHSTALPRPTVERVAAPIRALSGLRVPTPFNTSALEHAVLASHPFDRFLRLYHQLELLFDWVVIRRIHGLQGDLLGVGRIMSDYSAGDLHRLKHLISTYCSDYAGLATLLGEVGRFVPPAEDIFQLYSKDGNPLKEPDKWNTFKGCYQVGLSEPWAKTNKIATSPERFKELVYHLTAYWTYRVRCSIAHNRIGEYIIKSTDEPFVVNFSEPLLLEVLRQIFSNPDFRRL